MKNLPEGFTLAHTVTPGKNLTFSRGGYLKESTVAHLFRGATVGVTEGDGTETCRTLCGRQVRTGSVYLNYAFGSRRGETCLRCLTRFDKICLPFVTGVPA